MKRNRFLVSMTVFSLMLGLMILWNAQVASSSDEGSTDTVTLRIDGWTCRSCEKDIRRALLAVPGVKAADVSYPRGGAVVSVEPGRVNPEQLVKAVDGAGTVLSTYHATVIPNGTLTGEATSGDGAGSFLKKLFQ